MKKPDRSVPDINAYTVCGLVVLSHPHDYQQVLSRLDQVDCVDIHNSADTGHFAITVEEYPGTPMMTHQIEVVRNLKGVVDVSLAYTHTEPLGACRT